MQQCEIELSSYDNARAITKYLTSEDIRDIDLLELMDLAGYYGMAQHWIKSDYEIFQGVLRLGLGFDDIKTRFVACFRGVEPVFLASCKPSGTLCGFGWKNQDDKTSLNERIKIITNIITLLVVDGEQKSFKCYVHYTNLDTLKAWRLTSRVFRGSLFIDYIADETFTDYIRVEIQKICA